MATPESIKKAIKKHQAKFDTITIHAPKGSKERWRAHAQAKGKSMTAYIITQIESDITKEVKTMTININLIQDVYINSGEYRLHTDDGKPSIYVLREWYEAAATDENRNEYLIIWRVREDFNADENPDESDACDWDKPAEIIRLDDGANVTECAKINW